MPGSGIVLLHAIVVSWGHHDFALNMSRWKSVFCHGMMDYGKEALSGVIHFTYYFPTHLHGVMLGAEHFFSRNRNRNHKKALEYNVGCLDASGSLAMHCFLAVDLATFCFLLPSSC